MTKKKRGRALVPRVYPKLHEPNFLSRRFDGRHPTDQLNAVHKLIVLSLRHPPKSNKNKPPSAAISSSSWGLLLHVHGQKTDGLRNPVACTIGGIQFDYSALTEKIDGLLSPASMKHFASIIGLSPSKRLKLLIRRQLVPAESVFFRPIKTFP